MSPGALRNGVQKVRAALDRRQGEAAAAAAAEDGAPLDLGAAARAVPPGLAYPALSLEHKLIRAYLKRGGWTLPT